jgi:hypothetical protein
MGLYQSTIVGTQNGKTVDVVMGWHTSATTSAGDATTLANRIVDQFGGDVLPDLSADYTALSVDVIGVDDPLVGGTASWVASGGSAVESMPAFVVGNVQIVTGVRGRSYNGRFGLPGITLEMADSANNNKFNDGALAQLQSDVNDFRSDMGGGALPATMVVISRISGGTPRPSPIYTQSTSLVLHAAFGSRVSRKG